MFEKLVRILYVKPYAFTNESTGQVVNGVKVAYCYVDSLDLKDEKGYKTDFTNLDYKYADELLNADLPLEVLGKFTANSKNILKLVDISFEK